MPCHKTTFRPFSCALCLLTAMAFIGLVYRSGNVGLSHKSFAVFKVKPETAVDSFYYEQEEENNEAKCELPLHVQNYFESGVPELFISTLTQLSLKRLSLQLGTTKKPHYIVYRSLLI